MTERNGGAPRPRYPAYRPSGVEWLGDVPAHWEVRRLKYLVRMNPASLPEDTEPLRAISYVDVESVDSAGNVNDVQSLAFSEAPSRARRLVDEGDTIVSTVRTYLKSVALMQDVPDDRVVSTGFAVLRPGAEMSAKFLWRHSQSEPFIESVVANSEGVSYPAIAPTKLATLPCCLPPLSEQQAIAAFLDRETARIDALLAAKQRLLDLLAEKRAALITRAVTRGLDPGVPLKESGVAWLGQIPAHWEVIPLRRLAAPGYKTFVDGDWIESPFITSDGIRLIQTGNVGIGAFREQGGRFVSEDTFRLLQCTLVRPDDVLICRMAEPVGRACLAPNLGMAMITCVDVCILRPAREHDPRFLVYALSSGAYLNWMQTVCRGGTRDRVSRSMLGAIPLPMPPAAEQQAIAAYLDRQTARLDALAGRVRRAMELLCEYRAALITAAVTGQIDVRDPYSLVSQTNTEAMG